MPIIEAWLPDLLDTLEKCEVRPRKSCFVLGCEILISTILFGDRSELPDVIWKLTLDLSDPLKNSLSCLCQVASARREPKAATFQPFDLSVFPVPQVRSLNPQAFPRPLVGRWGFDNSHHFVGTSCDFVIFCPRPGPLKRSSSASISDIQISILEDVFSHNNLGLEPSPDKQGSREQPKAAEVMEEHHQYWRRPS